MNRALASAYTHCVSEDLQYQALGISAGFEVGRAGPVVIMGQRGTRPAAITAWVAGGLCLITAVHALVWPSLAMTGRVSASAGWKAGAGFALAAVLAFWIARKALRRYRLRRDAEIDEMPGLRANLTLGILLRDSKELTQLSKVLIDTPFNIGDSTQGTMRWVRLRWPGGSARVYSAGNTKAEAMAKALIDLGVGHRK